ncbi:MAG: hypothetical protein RR945_01410 [Erysipelotrichaceae bacterium]
MGTINLKYDYHDYDERLACEMKEVKMIYMAYKKNENNDALYQSLKQAIYNLQIATKVKVAEGSMNISEAEEMREFYWSLLL